MSAFYAVHVALKHREYDERNIVLLSKLIPPVYITIYRRLEGI